MKAPRLRKGIYYFDTREEAESFARAKRYPTDRIISFQVGYAIQLWVSGPYVGPDTNTPY